MAAPRVFLTLGAERDLNEICDYIAAHGSPTRADAVLAKIGAVIEKIALSPERGSFPKELLGLGIREYRQAFYKPYRIIYRVMAAGIFVFVIADGRRDLEALLSRRLLQP